MSHLFSKPCWRELWVSSQTQPMQEFISRVYLVTIKSRTAVETKDSETAPGTMPGKLCWVTGGRTWKNHHPIQSCPKGSRVELCRCYAQKTICKMCVHCFGWLSFFFSLILSMNKAINQKGKRKSWENCVCGTVWIYYDWAPDVPNEDEETRSDSAASAKVPKSLQWLRESENAPW